MIITQKVSLPITEAINRKLRHSETYVLQTIAAVDSTMEAQLTRRYVEVTSVTD